MGFRSEGVIAWNHSDHSNVQNNFNFGIPALSDLFWYSQKPLKERLSWSLKIRYILINESREIKHTDKCMSSSNSTGKKEKRVREKDRERTTLNKLPTGAFDSHQELPFFSLPPSWQWYTIKVCCAFWNLGPVYRDWLSLQVVIWTQICFYSLHKVEK